MKVRISLLLRALTLLSIVVAAEPCYAVSGELGDKVANFLAVFIIIALPIGGVILFWLVHILPEKAAEKRHHPQKDAIQVLCLLSLVFGGLLWPLAWLWAYTKPVLHKMAYGRDKHDEYYAEQHGERAAVAAAPPLHEELGRLRRELEELEQQGEMPNTLHMIRERLARLESQAQAAAPVTSGEEVR